MEKTAPAGDGPSRTGSVRRTAPLIEVKRHRRPDATPTVLFDLGVAITSFNSMRTIERTLRSVEGIAHRVVVIDSGSTDGTVELCHAHGASVVSRSWDGYVPQTQFAIEQCADHAWVLLLDSDESLEDDLRDSIRETLTADDPRCQGWEVNRKVWMFDDWLHHAFQPEWRLRLFRGGAGVIAGEGPHYHVVLRGRVGRLAGDLRHDTWADLSDMCRRYVNYGRMSAEAGTRGGGLFNLVASPPAAFIKQFIINGGFLDGRRGLIAAGGAAMGTLVKHLYIARRRLQRGVGRS